MTDIDTSKIRCIVCYYNGDTGKYLVWNPKHKVWNDMPHDENHIVMGEEAAMALSDQLKKDHPLMAAEIYCDHF